MKKSKALLLMLVTVLICSFAAIAAADSYNPFNDLHKAEAKAMRVRGQATAVVSILSSDRTPIGGAVLNYMVDGTDQSATADANGIVKLTFTNRVIYTYKSVTIGSDTYVVTGNDLTNDFDAEDLRKGDVNWDVFCMEGNGFTCYDAD